MRIALPNFAYKTIIIRNVNKKQTEFVEKKMRKIDQGIFYDSRPSLIWH